jgi:pimeloyl-ACP methyl ester carboxylesterase
LKRAILISHSLFLHKTQPEDIKMIFHYNNTPIYYTVNGSGPSILLLHGFLESHTMWDTIGPTYYKTHQVITLDFPGHGKSNSISEVHSMELFAEIAHALLRHLKVDKTTIIGHSMGGYVAMAMAEFFPQLLEKIVLLNATPAEDSPERKANRERAIVLVPKVKDAFVTMAIGNLFAEDSQKELAPAIGALKTEASKMTTEAILAAIIGMKDRKDRTEVLKEISKPKFMICGLNDPIMPIEECRSIAKQTHTEIFEVKGGHMSPIENTGSIIEILHFIEKSCT